MVCCWAIQTGALQFPQDTHLLMVEDVDVCHGTTQVSGVPLVLSSAIAEGDDGG